MSQDKGTDLATNSPNANTDSSNPQEQRIAEYKQLLSELPEDDTRQIIVAELYPGHSKAIANGQKRYNAALDQCRAIIEARIKELE